MRAFPPGRTACALVNRRYISENILEKQQYHDARHTEHAGDDRVEPAHFQRYPEIRAEEIHKEQHHKPSDGVQQQLERQRDAIQTQLSELPDAVRKARDHFIYCRAAMTEIELHEQLMPVMNALARASAARRQINYHHDESRFPVEIPRDLIEAASDALAAEMPAA